MASVKDEDVQDYSKFYQPDETLTDLSTPARQLFEQYSNLPPSEVLPHILRIRREAFAIHPYPCIGQFRFLQFSISLHPAYPKVLALLTSDLPEASKSQSTNPFESEISENTPPNPATAADDVPAYLDIGCCVGQDLRKLTFDGVPSTRLTGLELSQPFIDLGYTLFRDRETFQAALLAADILDDKFSGLFETMAGRFDVVHAASFFHLFTWEDQVTAAVRVVGMMKKRVGSMVVGRQVGNVRPGVSGTRQGGERFWHDLGTWRGLWEEVGRRTGSRWEVKAEVKDKMGEGVGADYTAHRDGTMIIVFEIARLE